ncbi:hypothetical protein EV426DRAFT_582068 [Tirmania nivea]|nr:hypothetical protein EV426DRAFT_582068 [Tirmania nivea]
MPSDVGLKDPASPAKSPSRKSKGKHDSKKRKRDAVNEGASDAIGMKKRKREEKRERKKEKKEKAKEAKNKDGKAKVKDAGDQIPMKEEKANKNLKEKLQSMVIQSLVTEPLCSNKSDTPGNPAIAIISTTPTSPLRPILKSREKRMDTIKYPLESVDFNAGKANGTLPLPKSALSKPTKPKKSVKFHSEAATEDGESRQRIHNTLIAAYKASEAVEEAAVTPEELADFLEAPAKKRKREKRKKEKEEKKKNGKDENAKRSALSYMLEYHKSRETWKFQKAKQNWILRNALDVTEIEGTKENDAALKAYIAGLQGQEARNRMLEEAKKILKCGEEDIEKDSGGDVEIDEEKEKKIARAKLVMIGLLVHNDEEDGEESIVEKDGKEEI